MTTRLRHLDSNKLTEMLNFSLRHILHHFSALDIDSPCSSCNIGKGKTLPFPLYHGISTALLVQFILCLGNSSYI